MGLLSFSKLWLSGAYIHSSSLGIVGSRLQDIALLSVIEGYLLYIIQ